MSDAVEFDGSRSSNRLPQCLADPLKVHSPEDLVVRRGVIEPWCLSAGMETQANSDIGRIGNGRYCYLQKCPGAILALRERRVAAAIDAQRVDLLDVTFCELGFDNELQSNVLRERSLLELAISFGHAEFAVAIAQLSRTAFSFKSIARRVLDELHCLAFQSGAFRALACMAEAFPTCAVDLSQIRLVVNGLLQRHPNQPSHMLCSMLDIALMAGEVEAAWQLANHGVPLIRFDVSDVIVPGGFKLANFEASHSRWTHLSEDDRCLPEFSCGLLDALTNDRGRFDHKARTYMAGECCKIAAMASQSFASSLRQCRFISRGGSCLSALDLAIVRGEVALSLALRSLAVPLVFPFSNKNFCNLRRSHFASRVLAAVYSGLELQKLPAAGLGDEPSPLDGALCHGLGEIAGMLTSMGVESSWAAGLPVSTEAVSPMDSCVMDAIETAGIDVRTLCCRKPMRQGMTVLPPYPPGSKGPPPSRPPSIAPGRRLSVCVPEPQMHAGIDDDRIGVLQPSSSTWSLAAVAIYGGQAATAEQLARHACDSNLSTQDIAELMTDGSPLHIHHAAVAAYHAARYSNQLAILQMSGWWSRSCSRVVVAQPNLIDKIATFALAAPPPPALAAQPSPWGHAPPSLPAKSSTSRSVAMVASAKASAKPAAPPPVPAQAVPKQSSTVPMVGHNASVSIHIESAGSASIKKCDEEVSKDDDKKEVEQLARALHESIVTDITRENADVGMAILQSKADCGIRGIQHLCVCHLSRRSCDVLEALLEAPSLAAARGRVQASGHDVLPDWANGAILLFPLLEEDVPEICVDLQPHHVVIDVEDMSLLEDVLAKMPKRRRPRIKLEDIIVDSAVGVPSGMEVDDPEAEEESLFIVDKTFVCICLPRDVSETSHAAHSEPWGGATVVATQNVRRFRLHR